MTKKKKKTYLEAFAELREIVDGAYDDVDDVVGYVNVLRHGEDNAQQSVHLTALRRGLALSLLFNVVLLAVVLAIIGGR